MVCAMLCCVCCVICKEVFAHGMCYVELCMLCDVQAGVCTCSVCCAVCCIVYVMWCVRRCVCTWCVLCVLSLNSRRLRLAESAPQYNPVPVPTHPLVDRGSFGNDTTPVCTGLLGADKEAQSLT